MKTKSPETSSFGFESRLAAADPEEFEEEDEDALYLEELQKTAARMRRAANDDTFDWDDWTDDEEIETAIDDVDAFDWLASSLREIQTTAPQRFQVCPPVLYFRVEFTIFGMRMCVKVCFLGSTYRMTAKYTNTLTFVRFLKTLNIQTMQCFSMCLT